MKTYTEACRKYDADKSTLKELRKRYASSPSKTLAAEIRQSEKTLETDLGRLTRLRSDVFRAEKKKQ